MRIHEKYKDQNLYQYCSRQRDYSKHLQRMKEIYSRSVQNKGNQYVVDDKTLIQANDMKERSSQFFLKQETQKLQHQNDLLLQRLINISQRPNSVSPTINRNQPRYPKISKTKLFREFQIQEENIKMNNRLINQQPTLSSKQMEAEFNKTQRYKMRIVKYQIDPRDKHVTLKALEFHQDYLHNQVSNYLPSLKSSRQSQMQVIQQNLNAYSLKTVDAHESSRSFSQENQQNTTSKVKGSIKKKSVQRDEELISRSLEADNKNQLMLSIYNQTFKQAPPAGISTSIRKTTQTFSPKRPDPLVPRQTQQFFVKRQSEKPIYQNQILEEDDLEIVKNSRYSYKQSSKRSNNESQKYSQEVQTSKSAEQDKTFPIECSRSEQNPTIAETKDSVDYSETFK